MFAQNPSNNSSGQLGNNSLPTGSTHSQGIQSTNEDPSDAEQDISQASSSQHSNSEQSSGTNNNQATRLVFINEELTINYLLIYNKKEKKVNIFYALKFHLSEVRKPTMCVCVCVCVCVHIYITTKTVVAELPTKPSSNDYPGIRYVFSYEASLQLIQPFLVLRHSAEN